MVDLAASMQQLLAKRATGELAGFNPGVVQAAKVSGIQTSELLLHLGGAGSMPDYIEGPRAGAQEGLDFDASLDGDEFEGVEVGSGHRISRQDRRSLTRTVQDLAKVRGSHANRPAPLSKAAGWRYVRDSPKRPEQIYTTSKPGWKRICSVLRRALAFGTP